MRCGIGSGGSWGGQRPSAACYVATDGGQGRGHHPRSAFVLAMLSLVLSANSGSSDVVRLLPQLTNVVVWHHHCANATNRERLTLDRSRHHAADQILL